MITLDSIILTGILIFIVAIGILIWGVIVYKSMNWEVIRDKKGETHER